MRTGRRIVSVVSVSVLPGLAVCGGGQNSPRGARNLLPAPAVRSKHCYNSTMQRSLSLSPSAELQENLKSILGDLNQFRRSTISLNELSKLRQLALLLLNDPRAAAEVWAAGAVPFIIELSHCGREMVEQQARMTLALLGHPPLFAGRGLRILAVDGGGTRGIIPLILLQRLEQLTGVRTHKLFDYVCGTSTGAILSAMLFVQRVGIEEAQDVYRKFSIQVFKMNNLLGIGQLFLNHAFYDSKQLERTIRGHPQSESYLYETSMDSEAVRLSVVSTVVNQPVMQPFLFTNYRHHPDKCAHTHYQNDCSFRVWEAVMASTAAPGFFEEVKLGPHVLQDGALLTNNPTAVALHEARLLWGAQSPIQTVVSLGTGFYSKPPTTSSTVESDDAVTSRLAPLKSTSLKDKLTKIVMSATDTEAVHTILKDVLPADTYFRFNPQLSEDVMMDESKPEKLEILTRDAESYLAANEPKLQLAAASLLQGKRPRQRVWEWVERGWNTATTRATRLTSK